jgi:fumarate reductase subunit C
MSVQTYRRPVSTLWWTRKKTYLIFVLRELSSIFVAWFVLYLLLFLRSVARGSQAYENFLHVAAHPVLVVINIIALLFVLLHVVTWFLLTAQTIAIRVGPRRLPRWAIIAAQYAGFVIVSGFVFWLVTR